MIMLLSTACIFIGIIVYFKAMIGLENRRRKEISSNPEFKKWPKTKRLLDTKIMTITQKMDGTNAQILITEDEIIHAGSRNRWLSAKRDNFGFYKWCQENKKALIETLGTGRHYGEFCGPKIQTGEGLDSYVFFSFNPRLYIKQEHQNIISPVPLLYHGTFSDDWIISSLKALSRDGSFAVPGFMKPEGLIVEISGTKYKIYLKDIDQAIKRFTDDLGGI